MVKALYLILSLAALALIAVLHLVPAETARRLIAEDGPVESLTAVAWFVGAAGLVLVLLKTRWRDAVSGAFILALAGLRELDSQKRFTTMSITKARFYLSPAVPLKEKVVVILVLAVIAAVVIRFCWRNLPIWWRGVRTRHAPSLAVLGGLAAVAVSEVLDRLPQVSREFGLPLPQGWPASCHAAEEVLELAGPCLLLAAMVDFYCRWSRSRAPPAPTAKGADTGPEP
jgi:hypothetical protein